MPCLTPLRRPWVVRVPLFLPLCAETQQAIDQAIQIKHYAAGQPIFLEGHRPTGLCIAVSGLVRIYRMLGDGKVHVHHYIRPYAALNMISALDGRPNPTSAEAVSATQIGWLSRPDLIHLMGEDSDLMQACIRLLTLQNRELMARLDDMSFRTVPSRLARLLLRYGSFEHEVNLPLDTLTQDEIAAVLGTSREVLGRALRQLYDTGFLRREGRHYVIINRAGLEKLAEE